MFRKSILYVFLLCLGYSASSQIGFVIDKKEGFKKVNSSQSKLDFSTKRLAFSITRNSLSDADKIKDIYSWIVLNITYDNELMRSEKLQKQIYVSEENVIQKVLDRKMALCGGFAFLFKSLCADVGIKAEVVHGFTKDYSGRFQDRKAPHHTWNVVRINGEWQLLDITWAISHGNGKQPDNFWYLTNPKDFIYSHYPEDSRWTLMENPISFSDFRNNN